MEQETPMLDPRLAARLATAEFGALSNWCENVECSIRLVHWLGGGKTSAKLAVVIIRDGYGLRKCVLKYCPSGSSVARDFRAFQRASASGPKGFAKRHLVGLDRAADKPIPNGADGLFLLMDWRIGGPDNYDTMSNLLDRDVLGTACEAVVASTLVEWNNVEHTSRGLPDELTAVKFLREIVGKRCEPGGPIRAAADRLGVSSSEAYLTILSPLLPNPLAAVTTGEWIEGMSVLGFRGNAHGDLHTDNILVPQPHNASFSTADFERYILIDLSTFSDKRLILVDPAHLLLSIIARRLPEMSASGRERLCRLVLEPEHGESGGIPVELVRAVRGIQRAGIAFAESGNLYQEWRIESLLATVGCALLFVGREIEDNSRRWFLQLAGMAIDAFRAMAQQRDGGTVNGGSPPTALSPDRPQERSTPEPMSKSRTAMESHPRKSGSQGSATSDTDYASHLSTGQRPSVNVPSVDDALRTLRGLLVEACSEPDEAQLIAQDAGIDSDIPFSKTAPRVFWNRVLRAAHISWRMESLFSAADSLFGKNPAWSEAKKSYWSACASVRSGPDERDTSADPTDTDISLYSYLPQRVEVALAAIVPAIFSNMRLATDAIQNADDALDGLDGLINALEFTASAHKSDPSTRASLNQTASQIRERRNNLKDILTSLRQQSRSDRAMLCSEIALKAIDLENDLNSALASVT